MRGTAAAEHEVRVPAVMRPRSSARSVHHLEGVRGGVGVVAESRPELDGVARGEPGRGVEGELAPREIARVGLEVDVDAGAGERLALVVGHLDGAGRGRAGAEFGGAFEREVGEAVAGGAGGERGVVGVHGLAVEDLEGAGVAEQQGSAGVEADVGAGQARVGEGEVDLERDDPAAPVLVGDSGGLVGMGVGVGVGGEEAVVAEGGGEGEHLSRVAAGEQAPGVVEVEAVLADAVEVLAPERGVQVGAVNEAPGEGR